MATAWRSCAWWVAAAPLSPDPSPLRGEGGLRSFSDCGLGLGALVPRLGAKRGPHRALVALARKKHRVTRLRQLDRSPDGGSPVDDDLEVTPRRLTGRAGLHVACDLYRVLAERIVGRDDEEVGELGRGTSHAGAVVVRARRVPPDS